MIGQHSPSHEASSAALTRERILDAAERLFAENGLQGVSTRDITSAADANLGAVNYHFGSKHGLTLAVFKRRFGPIDEKRFQMLDAADQKAGGNPPELREVLEAIIRPMIEEAFDRTRGTTLARLMGRVPAEAGETIDVLRKDYFIPLLRRFDCALKRVLPHLSEEERFWRMMFVFGALHLTLIASYQPIPEWPHYHLDKEQQVERMVAFAEAGLRAQA